MWWCGCWSISGLSCHTRRYFPRWLVKEALPVMPARSCGQIKTKSMMQPSVHSIIHLKPMVPICNRLLYSRGEKAHQSSVDPCYSVVYVFKHSFEFIDSFARVFSFFDMLDLRLWQWATLSENVSKQLKTVIASVDAALYICTHVRYYKSVNKWNFGILRASSKIKNVKSVLTNSAIGNIFKNLQQALTNLV